MTYPKRLIEVDLPIKRISAHARREKSIRHGHISTLHIWWARRPLAACRAVLCAALWPDPADPLCPEAFRETAKARMLEWAREHLTHASPDSFSRLVAVQKDPGRLDNPEELRRLLLDFIADFANWDNSTSKPYLETARGLTQAAHEALGGIPGTRPLVVDPFAGGGAIPLEALRVGADAFASDLNPVAVLLNKVMLEYIPKYGQQLADGVQEWGRWIKEQAGKELATFYPSVTLPLAAYTPQPKEMRKKDGTNWKLVNVAGETPIAYLWARTIQCEGPGCGAEVPLVRNLWLAKKLDRSVALKLVPRPEEKRVDFEILDNPKGRDVGEGTVRRGSATCPCCGYTTPIASVRRQLKIRLGGSHDARLMAIVVSLQVQRQAGNMKEIFEEQGRFYRLPTEEDLVAAQVSKDKLEQRNANYGESLSLILDEPTPTGVGSGAGRAFSQRNYGMEKFADLYTTRQLLALTSIAANIQEIEPTEIRSAIKAIFACALGRLNDLSMTLCRWLPSRETIGAANGGQNRMPVVLDFVEANPLGGATGSLSGQIDWISHVVGHLAESNLHVGVSSQAAFQSTTLPEDSADAFVTDPPYYDAFPYSDLSDFFYIWFKRCLKGESLLFDAELSPKAEEIVVYDVQHGSNEVKDSEFFRREMTIGFQKWRAVSKPTSIGVVVFANKTTLGWESLIQSLLDAGWVATASWPIDTERPVRQRAIESAALGSSVHVVCRPRENPDGSLRHDDIGDWRDVLQELPQRIHAWMPRLADEGVVGADAIFACLGPALEIFSRYSRVEKADGTPVPLRKYLEQVWAAVAKEALGMVFQGMDASSFEEDARLTAMWLWTLSAGENGGQPSLPAPLPEGEGSEQEDEESTKPAKVSGYVLEYDAARKIAQGLGANMEDLSHLVEIKGDQARLLPVSERTRHLFGKDEAETPARGRGKKKPQQADLFAELKEAEAESGWGVTRAPKAGATVLDRIHQSMILFAAGRGEALKRFLVEEGAGRDPRFWRLAQALSALYPAHTDEKRWVDGVLARKKGLGF